MSLLSEVTQYEIVRFHLINFSFVILNPRFFLLFFIFFFAF